MRRMLALALALAGSLALAAPASAAIYWTNEESGTIGRANLDGTGVEQSFIGGAAFPAGLAADGEHIYWTNYLGEGTISRAKLDGTGVAGSFITGASFPTGVAIDGAHVYWANSTGANPDTIGRAKLDGTEVEQSFITGALPGAVAPAGLAVVGAHIYWANDVEAGTVARANLDGTGVEKSFITGANYPAGVAVDAHTVTVSSSGSGTVVSSPAGIDCGEGCAHPFAAGTTVMLTATPEFGWIFAGWSGGGCSDTSSTCELTMDSDQTVTASFIPGIFLIIHKVGTGSGTVTSSPAGIECGASCQGLFPTMTAVTLTAMPDPGSLFAAWSGGGCVGSSPTCEITPNTDWDIFATFNTARTLTVEVSGTGSGTVTSSPAGIDCGTGCSHEFEDGTVVELEATSGPGSRFAGWSGTGCSAASPICEVTMDGDRRVSANFAGPPPPPPPPPRPQGSSVAGQPSNRFSVAGIKRNKRSGAARLTIRVNAPGTLRLARGRLVRRSIRPVPRDGTVRMLVRPTKRASRLLRKRGRARVTVAVTFTPTGGEPSTKRRRLTLVRR